jgi:aryl-alcohol dehydrogenase-like predicted oxidoreductase
LATKVSKLGLGCFGLTGAYGSALDDEAAAAVIAHAFRRGVTFFDTSDIYGPLTNEILLGKVRSVYMSVSVVLAFLQLSYLPIDRSCFKHGCCYRR